MVQIDKDFAARDAMRFDGLAEAEQVTGKSYKDDYVTSLLGMAMQMEKNATARRLLQERGDSHFGISFGNFARVLQRDGFTEVLCGSFPARHDNLIDLWKIWFDLRRGVLVFAESYGGGKSVKSGKAYYNVRPNDDRLPFRCTSSGHYKDGVWVGDHDVREGLVMNLRGLEENGTFITPWIEAPHLWLITYMEGEELRNQSGSVYGSLGRYRQATRDRAAMLPEQVRKAIQFS